MAAQPAFAQGNGAARESLFERVRGVVSHDRIAAQLKELGDTARLAVITGNCVRKTIYVNRLWDIYRDSNHAFWARHHLAGDSPSLQAARQKHLDAIYREVAEINQLPCPPEGRGPQKNEREILVDFGAGITRIRMPQRGLLGFETGGVPRTGVVSPDRDATGAAFAGSFRYYNPNLIPTALSFGAPATSYLEFQVFYNYVALNQNFGPIDPGAGTSLLIPGPRGGASGFSLGANPFNVVRDARYSADLSQTGAAIKIGQTTKASEGVTAGITASVGYARIGFDERFSGAVPGFARTFAYDSSVNVDQARLRLGTEFTFRTRTVTDGGLEFRSEIKVSADVGPDFSHGSGDDRLSFTGFPDSSVNIGKTKTDLGFSAGISAGLEFPNGVKLSAEARYIRENGLPVLVRNGTSPTRLELEGGDAFIGIGRVTVPFAAPPPPP